MGWLFGGSDKYSRLPTEDDSKYISDYAKSAFQFDSAFSYDKNQHKGFKSVFKFEAVKETMEADYYKYIQNKDKEGPPLALRFLSFLLTSFSYLLFLIGFPITYWFCVLKLGESDRLVVFRLGKMSGVKGPGRVLVFPWLDTFKRVDVQASAFSVPPQQFISKDGGIAEMGAEIQYEIVDVETMVKEVADHQDILRSLGRSLMTKVLTKKTVCQLTKDKRIAAEDILKELNNQVRKWGIDIRMVILSDAKVLKKPENKSSLNPILQNLGLKQEKQFPSPQQFIHHEYFGEEMDEKDPNAEALNTLASAVGGYFTGEQNVQNLYAAQQNGGVSIPPGGGKQQYVSLLGGAPEENDQPGPSWRVADGNKPARGPPATTSGWNGGAVGGSGVSAYQGGSGQFQQSAAFNNTNGVVTLAAKPPGDQNNFWKGHLESLLAEDDWQMDTEAMGVYQIIITNTPLGRENYMIDISPGCNRVKKHTECQGLKPLVTVTIDSGDLLAVLQGTLSPLQAYLTGRISATGDVKKLMFFDKLSARGHKQGGMFNI